LIIMDGMNRHARSWFRRSVIAAGIAIPLITAFVWMRSTQRTLPTARIETPNGPIVVEIADHTRRAGGRSLESRRPSRHRWDAAQVGRGRQAPDLDGRNAIPPST
jgi:hypothetical protein